MANKTKLKSGEKFGEWTCIIPIDPNKPRNGVFRCSCGNVRSNKRHNIMTGRSKSCGCKTGENVAVYHRQTTGFLYSDFPSERGIWNSMKNRCRNPNVKEYVYYGGRGITVCDRWLGRDGFVNFLKDMGKRPTGYTLDRIDTNGNYTPENCRWATRIEQANNTRANRFVNLPEGRMTFANACRLFGLNRNTVTNRIWRNNESPEDAINHFLRPTT